MQITIENTNITLTIPDNTASLELIKTDFDGVPHLELLAKLKDNSFDVVCEDQYTCSLLHQAGFSSITIN